MAKIVSEKREVIIPNPNSNATVDKEPRNTPLVTALGAVLTIGFMAGAVAMVVMAFRQ